MEKFNYKQIVSILAFLGLAGFSCFWTAESLYIWQPSITIVGGWLIAIVFYIIASICFSKIMTALDKNEYLGGKTFGRGGQLTLGFMGLVVFWLMISLPTNTHTLLYRASIKNIITSDLRKTKGYLEELKDNNVAIKQIEKEKKEKENKVRGYFIRLTAEASNPSALGIGERFKTALAELENELGMKIQKYTKKSVSRTQWLAEIDYYREQAYRHLEAYNAQRDKEIAEIRKIMDDTRELPILIGNMNKALSDISRMEGVDNLFISEAVKDLTRAYSYIKTNAKYIIFEDNDRERYVREGAIPEAQAMLSVPDVWKDFITTNKYDGHGFIWWVFIALLVDLAGFIFFNLAVKYRNNVI